MNGNLLPGTLEAGFRRIYLADRESSLLCGCDLETNGATRQRWLSSAVRNLLGSGVFAAFCHDRDGEAVDFIQVIG